MEKVDLQLQIMGRRLRVLEQLAMMGEIHDVAFWGDALSEAISDVAWMEAVSRETIDMLFHKIVLCSD
jgi:hypothetical protein